MTDCAYVAKKYEKNHNAGLQQGLHGATANPYEPQEFYLPAHPCPSCSYQGTWTRPGVNAHPCKTPFTD